MGWYLLNVLGQKLAQYTCISCYQYTGLWGRRVAEKRASGVALSPKCACLSDPEEKAHPFQAGRAKTASGADVAGTGPHWELSQPIPEAESGPQAHG